MYANLGKRLEVPSYPFFTEEEYKKWTKLSPQLFDPFSFLDYNDKPLIKKKSPTKRNDQKTVKKTNKKQDSSHRDISKFCPSSLSAKEQSLYLCLREKYKRPLTCQPTEEELIEKRCLQDLQIRVHQENEQFQKYLFEFAQNHKKLYNQTRPPVENFFKKKLEADSLRRRKYPRYYKHHDKMSLNLSKETSIPLTFRQTIMNQTIVPKLSIPLKYKEKVTLNKYIRTQSSVLPNNREDCFFDTCLLEITKTLKFDYVLSLSAFRCLANNCSPKFSSHWQLPVVVQQKDLPSQSYQNTKVIFIGKPFINYSVTPREKNTLYFKHMLKQYLKRLDGPKHNTDRCVTRSRLSRPVNKKSVNAELFEASDYTELETFGTERSINKTCTISSDINKLDKMAENEAKTNPFNIADTRSSYISNSELANTKVDMNHRQDIQACVAAKSSESKYSLRSSSRTSLNGNALGKDTEDSEGIKNSENLACSKNVKSKPPSSSPKNSRRALFSESDDEPNCLFIDLPSDADSNCVQTRSRTKLFKSASESQSDDSCKSSRKSSCPSAKLLSPPLNPLSPDPNQDVGTVSEGNVKLIPTSPVARTSDDEDQVNVSNLKSPHIDTTIGECASNLKATKTSRRTKDTHSRLSKITQPITKINTPLDTILGLQTKLFQSPASNTTQLAGADVCSRWQKTDKSYEVWSLGHKTMVIRYGQHGMLLDQIQNKPMPVNILSKLEYQSQYGLEQMTLSEAITSWINTYIRKSHSCARARLDAFTTEILGFDYIPVTEILPSSCQQLEKEIFQRTYNILAYLESLEAGQYLLTHTAGCDYCDVMQAEDKMSEDNCDLYDLLSNPTTPISDEVPWVPLDPNVLRPFHWAQERIPATFSPQNHERHFRVRKRKRRKTNK